MKNTAFRVGVALGLFLAIRVFLVSSRGVTNPYWYTLLIPCTIFALAFLEIAWTKRSFERLEPIVVSLLEGTDDKAARKWYRYSVRRMFNVRDSFKTAVLFAPLVVFACWSIKWASWHQDPILRWYDFVGVACMFSSAASSQWPFSNISIFMVRLPRKRLHINFYAHPRDTIMALGAFMLKIVLGGIFLTFLTGLMLYLSPCKTSEFVYCLLIAVFIWAIVWFFVTQYNVHECMVMQKRHKLWDVGRKLLEALEISVKEPTAKNLANQEAIGGIYERLNRLPEWPFNLQNVLTLFSSVVIPIALTVLKLLLP